MKVAASAHQVEITPECLVIAAGGSCDLLLLSFLGEGEKMCSFSEVHFSSRLYQHGLSEGNLTFPDNNMPWVFFFFSINGLQEKSVNLLRFQTESILGDLFCGTV